MTLSRWRVSLTMLLIGAALCAAGLLIPWAVHAQSQPTAPSNLTAEIVGDGIVPNWEATSEDLGWLTGYEVLRLRPRQGEHMPLTYVAVPQNVALHSGGTRKSFEVMPVDGASGEDPRSVEIAFGAFPPGAQSRRAEATLQDNEVWSADMTVGSNGAYLGYSTYAGSVEGSLTEDEFSWRGTTYTVTSIVLSPLSDPQLRNVSIHLSPGLPEGIDSLSLLLGDLRLNLADGRLNTKHFSW